MARARHGDKDLEAVLREAERKGWLVTKGKRYFMMWCPNPCKCKKSVKLTPSGNNYRRNLLGELRRKTCWKDEL